MYSTQNGVSTVQSKTKKMYSRETESNRRPKYVSQFTHYSPRAGYIERRKLSLQRAAQLYRT